MVRVNPQEGAAKWASRTSAATPEYVSGIRRVTQAPGAAAAARKQDYATNTAAAVDKWAMRVAAVPLNEWQNMAATKGAQNLAVGVQAAQNKMAQANTQLYAAVDNAVAKLQSMPKGNYAARMARQRTYADAMHETYNGGGGLRR